MSDKKNCLGEIIESSLKSWKGVCWDLNQTPDFGELLVVSTSTTIIFGVVYDIQSGSIDSSRVPFAYQKTQEELLQQQPQIFEFLRTTFSCLTVGFADHGVYLHSFAPKPPQVHSFVARPSSSQLIDFLANLDYFRFFFGIEGGAGDIDELLLAHVRFCVKNKLIDPASLIGQLQVLGDLSGDYVRMRRLLQRIEMEM